MHAGDGIFFFLKSMAQHIKRMDKTSECREAGSLVSYSGGWKAESMPKESGVLQRKAVAAIHLQSSDAKGLRKSKQCSTSPFPSMPLLPWCCIRSVLVPLPADSRLFKCPPWFWVSLLSNLLQSVRREDVHGQLSGSK